MKVLALTSTRADWGIYVPLLDLLRDDARFELEILATGQHFMAGTTPLQVIAADGHVVNWPLDIGLGADDSSQALAQGMGRLIAGIGSILATSRPDLLLVLGDRYETLAAALAAVVARVPVAHLFGGDITEGAIDDSIRHAITKLSALHFASNAESAARIRQLGEDPAHVHDVGSIGIDRILAVPTLERAEFFASIALAPQARNFLITFHPATLAGDPLAEARNLLDALTDFPEAGLIFTGSNADPGARGIDALIIDWVATHPRAVFHDSLGSQRYFSALRHCDLVIGNSSSGLLEAPSFQIPTINIGERQARRPRAASVIDTPPTRAAIAAAIQSGLGHDCSQVANPYGDGQSAGRILSILARLTEPATLTRKSFVDLPQ